MSDKVEQAKHVCHVDELCNRCMGLRLKVTSTWPLQGEIGRAGILCVGVRSLDGDPMLVMITDEAKLNAGERARECMEELLVALRERWDGALEVGGANVVLCDESGSWDLVVPTWSRSGEIIEVQYAPAKWPGASERGVTAVIGAFGDQANRAIHASKVLREHRL